MALRRPLVLVAHGLERGASLDRREDDVSIDPDVGQHATNGFFVAEVAALVVAQRAERLVSVEELIREAVSHDGAGLEGPEAGVVLGTAPDVRLALLHVHLTEGARKEGQTPTGRPWGREKG